MIILSYIFMLFM